MTPLKDIIAAQYLHKADSMDEYYTLSSGEKSSHYYDIKAMMGDRNHMNRLVNLMSHKIFKEGIDFKSIGGTELGGIPLATALQQNYKDVPVCFIRKSERIHGMKKMLEGVPANPILLLDDVLYSGKSIMDAQHICRNEGFEIAACLVVINRFRDTGTGEHDSRLVHLEKFMGVKIYSLFEEKDFGY